MLVEFSVGNFLSFKTKTTLSLAATSIKEHVDSNIFSTERSDLLKGAVIYGANASGKSNFIRAMSTMRRLVLQSFEQSSREELDITPFLLNTERIVRLRKIISKGAMELFLLLKNPYSNKKRWCL